MFYTKEEFDACHENKALTMSGICDAENSSDEDYEQEITSKDLVVLNRTLPEEDRRSDVQLEEIKHFLSLRTGFKDEDIFIQHICCCINL